MQPDPFLYLNREQRDRQAKLDERSLEHGRLVAEARRDAASTTTPDDAAPLGSRVRALTRRFAGLGRRTTETSL